MQNIVYAFLLCVISAVGIYLLLMTVGGLPETSANGLAGLIIAAFPKIHESIEKWRKKRSDEPAEVIASLGKYDVSANRAIVYVTATGFAALNFSLMMATYAVMTPGQNQLAVGKLGVLSCFPVAIFLFFVGRWVGRRCAPQGMLVIAVSATLISLLTGIFNRILFWEVVKTSITERTLVQVVVIGMLASFVTMFVGLLFGKRERLSNYLSYLLKQLDAESQQIVVDMAYRETLGQSRMATYRKLGRTAYVMGMAGPYEGNRIPLQFELVFGRDPKTCHVVFKADQEGISSRHCSLRFDSAAEGFELRDLGSKNGTYAKGNRLRSNEIKRLRDGDEFYLHTVACRFVVHLGS